MNELFRDKSFDELFIAAYIPKEIKAELRGAAVVYGTIHGSVSDYQPPTQSSSAATAKNTYQ